MSSLAMPPHIERPQLCYLVRGYQDAQPLHDVGDDVLTFFGGGHRSRSFPFSSSSAPLIFSGGRLASSDKAMRAFFNSSSTPRARSTLSINLVAIFLARGLSSCGMAE